MNGASSFEEKIVRITVFHRMLYSRNAILVT